MLEIFLELNDTLGTKIFFNFSKFLETLKVPMSYRCHNFLLPCWLFSYSISNTHIQIFIKTDLKFEAEMFYEQQLFMNTLTNMREILLSRDQKEVVQLSSILNASAIKSSGNKEF